jgi:hypothetical protein
MLFIILSPLGLSSIGCDDSSSKTAVEDVSVSSSLSEPYKRLRMSQEVIAKHTAKQTKAKSSLFIPFLILVHSYQAQKIAYIFILAYFSRECVNFF